jgi:hypothetical protein
MHWITNKPANRFIKRVCTSGSAQTLRRLIRHHTPFIKQNHAIGNLFHFAGRVRRKQESRAFAANDFVL